MRVNCSICQALPDCVLSPLLSSDLEELPSLAVAREIPARVAVYSEGEPADGIYILCRGTLKLTESTAAGQRRILSFVAPGQVFGLDALVTGRERSHTATARQNASSLYIARPDFTRILARSNVLLWRFAGMLSFLLQNAQQRQLASSGRRVRHRIVTTLLGCDAQFHLNQMELSELLGIPAETVSREIAALRAAGLVEVKDGIVVPTRRLQRTKEEN